MSKSKQKAEVLVPGQWLLATHDGRQDFVPNPNHERGRNCDNGYDVLFVKNNCTVINKNDQSIVFKGKRRNNVYKNNFLELTDQKVLCLLSMSDKKWL